MLSQNGHESPRWVQFGDRHRGPDSACAEVGAVASTRFHLPRRRRFYLLLYTEKESIRKNIPLSTQKEY